MLSSKLHRMTPKLDSETSEIKGHNTDSFQSSNFLSKINSLELKLYAYKYDLHEIKHNCLLAFVSAFTFERVFVKFDDGTPEARGFSQ